MQIKRFLWYLFWYILYPLREKNTACKENFSSWTEDTLSWNKKVIWYYKHEKTKLHKRKFLDKYFSCQPKFNNKEFLLSSEGCCGAVESSPRVPAMTLQPSGVSGRVPGTYSTQEQPLDKCGWTYVNLQVQKDSLGLTHSERATEWVRKLLLSHSWL